MNLLTNRKLFRYLAGVGTGLILFMMAQFVYDVLEDRGLWEEMLADDSYDDDYPEIMPI